MRTSRIRDGFAVALIGAAIAALYRGRLQPWLYTWGADDREVTDALPGDELIVPAAPRTTRALTLNAPTTTERVCWSAGVAALSDMLPSISRISSWSRR